MPLMRTHPERMSSSARLREATPASAIALFSLVIWGVSSTLRERVCCSPFGRWALVSERAGSVRVRFLAAGALDPRSSRNDDPRLEDDVELRCCRMAILIVSVKDVLNLVCDHINGNCVHTLVRSERTICSAVVAARTAR